MVFFFCAETQLDYYYYCFVLFFRFFYFIYENGNNINIIIVIIALFYTEYMYMIFEKFKPVLYYIIIFYYLTQIEKSYDMMLKF